jgi:hypothetical protein
MRLAFVLMATVLSLAPREWRDSIRDVYVNGKLDRSAQTLVTSSPRMFAIVCGDQVVYFDPQSSDVSSAPKSEFAFSADRMTATSAAEPKGARAGSVVKATDSTYLATLDGKTLLVTSHQSKAGPMTIEELWQTAPTWHAINETYEPDPAILERLRRIDTPVRLQIVMATWCGDSRQHVPRLLKSIAKAANPNVTVELIGIGPDFTTPMDVVQGENITNVPTVIVRKGANEIGRFVETPAGATVEDDIVDIVNGTPKPHPGRHERGALKTSGTYLLRNARHRVEGTEQFEVYEKIIHSVIRKRDGTSIETFASPEYVEVTSRGTIDAHLRATVTRARFRKTHDGWSAESRGADGGIVDQTLNTPNVVVTPATVTYAWARNAASAYVIPEHGMGEVRAVKMRVAEGDVPKFVRLEDGSTRKLMKR